MSENSKRKKKKITNPICLVQIVSYFSHNSPKKNLFIILKRKPWSNSHFGSCNQQIFVFFVKRISETTFFLNCGRLNFFQVNRLIISALLVMHQTAYFNHVSYHLSIWRDGMTHGRDVRTEDATIESFDTKLWY